jgi:hypothetical protein
LGDGKVDLVGQKMVRQAMIGACHERCLFFLHVTYSEINEIMKKAGKTSERVLKTGSLTDRSGSLCRVIFPKPLLLVFRIALLQNDER